MDTARDRQIGHLCVCQEHSPLHGSPTAAKICKVTLRKAEESPGTRIDGQSPGQALSLKSPSRNEDMQAPAVQPRLRRSGRGKCSQRSNQELATHDRVVVQSGPGSMLLGKRSLLKTSLLSSHYNIGESIWSVGEGCQVAAAALSVVGCFEFWHEGQQLPRRPRAPALSTSPVPRRENFGPISCTRLT